MSIVCPYCKDPRDLRRQLEAPTLLLKDLGVCKTCGGGLFLEKESIEYLDNTETGPTIFIGGDLVCQNCAYREKKALEISSATCSSLIQSESIEMEFTGVGVKINDQDFAAQTNTIESRIIPDMENEKILAESSIAIVIITALAKERDAILRHLDSKEEISIKNRTYHRSLIHHTGGKESYDVVVLSLPSMGNVEASIATTEAINVWNPRYIILAGITGGIRNGENHYLGDIIVGEQIVGYEPGRQSGGRVERRFQVVRPAFSLLEIARTLPPERWALSATIPRSDGTSGRVIPRVHFGVVASGEKVVADKELVTELKSSWSRLVGIEMEAYGTALSAYEAESVPGMLMIKGICDWADSSKNDDWQEYAADVAAAFTVALLKAIPFDKHTKKQAIRVSPAKYSSRDKIRLCKRLGDDWRDLADYFEIPLRYRGRFAKGFECQEIWEWLEQRNKLDGIKEALRLIDRGDLAEALDSDK